MLKRAVTCAAVLLIAAAFARAGTVKMEKGKIPVLQPSKNKGRSGTYQAKTSFSGNNYYVYVPKSYSQTNPAGLVLFFHGQGGQKGAKRFGSRRILLEPFNLIGINMQYMDGNNSKNKKAKVASAKEAVAQVMADYAIVEGRGIITSFSGGGLPHGKFYRELGLKRQKRGHNWPFSHTSLYGSNFWVSTSGGLTMSWVICIGQKEYPMALPTLGKTGTKCMRAVSRESARGNSFDMYFKILKDKKHKITKADIHTTAQVFRRTDLTHSPFVRAANYPEKELRTMLRYLANLTLGRALKEADRLAALESTPEDVKKKAAGLKKQTEARVEKIMKLMAELSTTDFVLADYYSKLWLKQLAGHPREKELRDLASAARRNPAARTARQGYDLWWKSFHTFLTKTATLIPKKEQDVEKIRALVPEKSAIGLMTAEFLELK